MSRTRLIAVMGALALVTAACTSASPTNAGDQPGTTVDAGATSRLESAPTVDSPPTGLPAGPSALADPEAVEFPEPLVPVDQILSGGPPPDGIPPIDAPVFMSVKEAGDLLDPAESIVALEINGDARAYPVRAMVWHEIVNDSVGGTPVVVTYCPLCNSAISYVREIRGVETTFGTSGRLYASALVMYDRATESLWTHFDGSAVVGVLTGDRLLAVASPLMAWEDFSSSYPEGTVLNWNETGFRRDYGTNPYVGYDDADAEPFLFRGPLDDRARAMQRVVGISIGGEATAYPLESLMAGDATATPANIGGRDLVIFWKAGQASALDASAIDEGKPVGSVGVFAPRVDGRQLTFVADGPNFVDRETGSIWTIAGTAVAGELAGSELERIEHLDTFWFAWSTYRPGTTLVEG